jgi:hypothetical protein
MDDFQQDTPIVGQTLDQLRASLDALDAIAANPSTDSDAYQATLDQKIEIERRITILLNLQLVEDTDKMQALLPDFKKATADLDAVVGTVCKASDVVNKVTTILKVVDAIVAAAKTVA